MLGAMRRGLKRLGFAALAALFVAVAAYWAWLPSTSKMDRESYAAMSAYIAGGLTGDSHDLGSVNGLVILYGRTTNGTFRILPPTWSHFDSRMMRFEAVLRSLTSHRLERKFDLRAPYIFTNDASIAGRDLTEAQQRAGYGTITFSKVIFNHDAKHAVFYTEHLCGSAARASLLRWKNEKESGLSSTKNTHGFRNSRLRR
jgi:hypothetical protein